MRLFFFITKSELGGAQTHVAQLVQYCVSQGDEVAVMSAPCGWLEAETTKLGAMFFPNTDLANTANPFQLWSAHTQFLKATNAFKPDLVTCHSTIAGLVGRLTIRNRIPTIFTAHGWGFTNGTSLLRRLIVPIVEKVAACFSQKIICVSQNDLQLALTYHITAPKNLVQIYNGIEQPHLRLPQASQPSHKIRLIFIGRFAPPKDPLLLLHAIALLPTSQKNSLELTLVGNGPLRSDIEQTIRKLHLTQVRLTGSLSREQTSLQLQNADLFILPTRYEGFPYTILEAMAHGLPVIVSDVGGVKEAVSNDAGILVPPNDVTALTHALEQLIAHPEQRVSLGAHGLHKVQTLFSLKSMCEKTRAVYLDMLQNNKTFR